MKRLLFCLSVIFTLFISGCVTYQYYDKVEDRQLSQEQIFKKTSLSSQFSIANSPTASSINLVYIQNYDAYTVTKVGRFMVNYRQPSVTTDRWGDTRATGPAEKIEEKELRESSTESLAQKNAKAEQLSIIKGQEVVLSFGANSKLNFTLDQDGIIALDNSIRDKILSAIDNIENLKSVKVDCKELGLSQTLDLSSAQALHNAMTGAAALKVSLDAYRVTSSDASPRYNDAQNALLGLVKPLHYRYEKLLVQSAYDSNYQVAKNALQSQIDSLQSGIPSFVIVGDIRDSDIGYIQVWGTAVPRPMSSKTMMSLGYQRSPANLIIESPDTANIRGGLTYVAMVNYFVAKEYGTNALGGKVPIYRFTTQMPADYKPIQDQITDIQGKIDTIDKAHADANAIFSSK